MLMMTTDRLERLRNGLRSLRLLLLALTVLLSSFLGTLLLVGPAYSPSRGILASPLPEGYMHKTARNGVELHLIETRPEDISLKAIDRNVTDLPDNGINGGFFWQGNLLSIAVVNDLPVKGAPGDYGSGWYNTDRPRGTLVWDAVTGRFSVQVAAEAKELQVTDRSRYWAQGGVSMGLRSPDSWKAQALSEEFPAMEEKRLRTGMVYDTDGKLWLAVTDTLCTGEAFRDALLEQVASGRLVDGIFLDGDGSSQLKLEQVRLVGDRRPVYQMIALRPKAEPGAPLAVSR